MSPNEVVNSPNELHIPVGIPVVIRAMSRDVIHSFWVPNLHGKRDLFPGFVTHTWIQADRPGVYRGQCAEFCGHQHAHMAFEVVVEPMNAFLRWLQQQRRGALQPSTDAARRGHDRFMAGACVMCHTIRGTSAGSRVGPDLTHLASRRMLAAGTLPAARVTGLEPSRQLYVVRAKGRPPTRGRAPLNMGPDHVPARRVASSNTPAVISTEPAIGQPR